MTNKNSTRYFSNLQETTVAKKTNSYKQVNSGATNFSKFDVLNKEASLGIECKTCMTNKNSFSIKKDWIIKNKKEAFDMRLSNTAIAFNFGPNEPNYYIIDERLMTFLIEKLKEENN